MKINLTQVLAICFSMLMVFSSFDASAQKKRKKKGDDAKPEKKEEDSYGDLVKKCVKYEGLFAFYQDTVTGKAYLEIDEDQLDKEFIYFSHVENGVLDAGFFRGAYRGSKIISFSKHYEKIEVQGANTSFYFDEENALSKASEANINRPVIISQKIEAESKEGDKILVDGDALFLSEQFQMIKPPSNPKRPGFLGSLSKGKTKIRGFNNYPENSEVTVDYIYTNKSPKSFGSSAVTDARNVTLTLQHSLVQVPENNFVPRYDDSRAGFFMTQVTDLTSFSVTPYRDVIHRWNLEKKDPALAISEPIEPIVYWIENTTPEEFRPIIKDALERWNIAFEKAGFKNAIVAKIQPDDADWEAGDIRYNVIRWTSSPRPPFGGYGPSFVNPRTGEILGADIMIEFSSITRRLFRTEVFQLAGYETDQDYEEAEALFGNDYCSAGNHMHNNMMFGLHAMRAMNVEKAAEDEFVQQTLYRLILHEVGHTLGLSHNMRASTLLTPDEIKNKAIVDKMGLCNSVMEYPSINYARNKEDQTLYYDDKPGPYDHWVIEFGYSQGVEDPVKEQERLEKILSRSTEHQLAFGNDADDMRSSGKGIDPDVNIYDLSSDPVAYGVERCELVRDIMPKIMEEYVKEGQSYQELRNAYFVLSGEYGTQIRVMTRQIGGVHYDRSLPEQNSGNAPYTPVEAAKQKAAMTALAKYAFAPDAFDIPEDIYTHLQPQRRGFSNFANNEDPHIHARNRMMQVGCLQHLLHYNVLMRISDSQLYGNTYTLDKYMDDLTDAIFKADQRTAVNTTRQNLQITYVEMLVSVNAEKSRHDDLAKSMAWYELDRIKKMMNSGSSPNVATKAHRMHVKKLIDDALASK